MTPQQQANAAVADPICTLSAAVNQAIDIAMGEDPEVFALGEAIEDLGQHAAAHGVPLFYEPLNRYETNLFNLVGETRES